MSWHLAQFNIATMAYPIDDPRMAGFVDQLDPVNALGDAAPGFVWRHQDEAGDSTSVRVFDDPNVIINFTVWESVEALRAFTYADPSHKELLRSRREWFAPTDDGPILVMWWIPAGEIPTVAEGKARLEHLREHGPTDHAFTFRHRVAPPT